MVNIEERTHGMIVTCDTNQEGDFVRTVISQTQDEFDLMHRIKNPRAEPKIKDTYALTSHRMFVVASGVGQMIVNHLKARKFEHRILNIPKPLGALVDFTWTADFKLRHEQIPVGKFFEENEQAKNILVTCPPGFGKTLLSIYQAINRGKRTTFIMRPGYISQWTKVLTSMTNLKKSDIYYISSGADITKLEKILHTNQFHYKAVLVSNKSYDRYVKKYMGIMNSQATDCPIAWKSDITPLNIWERMEIGTMIIDEVHSDLRFWHTFLSTLNVESVLGLSGTFISRDPFILRMHSQMFIEGCRYDSLSRKPYINYVTFGYQLSFNGMTTENRGMKGIYNHTAYEKSILKNHHACEEYFQYILKAIRAVYLTQVVKDPSQKYRALVYVGLVELGKRLVKYLKRHIPNIEIGTYNAGDDYETLMRNAITTSTPSKASTGVDIAMLLGVIDTTNSNSLTLNVQKIGRCRKIETPLPITYVQFNNSEIKKHQKYQFQRDKDLKPYIASHFAAHG